MPVVERDELRRRAVERSSSASYNLRPIAGRTVRRAGGPHGAEFPAQFVDPANECRLPCSLRDAARFIAVLECFAGRVRGRTTVIRSWHADLASWTKASRY